MAFHWIDGHHTLRHLASIVEDDESNPEGHLIRATGRYYTSRAIAGHLLGEVWEMAAARFPHGATVTVCDPFAGDGRLVDWFIQLAVSSGRDDLSWHVTLWDLHGAGLCSAAERINELAKTAKIAISLGTSECDAFLEALNHEGRFDIVITNPPWENLKPDRRELKNMPESTQRSYVSALREYDRMLAMNYPLSQPRRKFAGWGTNLGRVGVEAALRLLSPRGVAGIVSPASLLADDSSVDLRRWILSSHTLKTVSYFPAESRQFNGADVGAVTVVLHGSPAAVVEPRVTVFDRGLGSVAAPAILHPRDFLESSGFVIPLSFGLLGMEVLLQLSHLPRFGDLARQGLWAGREIDETGMARWLAPSGAHPFVKGRMLTRFAVSEEPTMFVRRSGWRIPPSVAYERLAWRDVARPSQKRRVIASIIPPGWIAGNSLGVAYFKDSNPDRLRALLGLMLSVVFEFQLRSFLATGHVSLAALRKVHIPELVSPICAVLLVEAVTQALEGRPGATNRVEAVAAHAYGLTRETFCQILGAFPKLTDGERDGACVAYDAIERTGWTRA